MRMQCALICMCAHAIDCSIQIWCPAWLQPITTTRTDQDRSCRKHNNAAKLGFKCHEQTHFATETMCDSRSTIVDRGRIPGHVVHHIKRHLSFTLPVMRARMLNAHQPIEHENAVFEEELRLIRLRSVRRIQRRRFFLMTGIMNHMLSYDNVQRPIPMIW